MPPEPYTQQEYVASIRELASRIEVSLADAGPSALPIRVDVTGRAALHFQAIARVTQIENRTLTLKFTVHFGAT